MTVHADSSYYNSTGTPNRGRTYDVSADGTRFLRIKVEPLPADTVRGGLVVFVNWFDELKRRMPRN